MKKEFLTDQSLWKKALVVDVDAYVKAQAEFVSCGLDEKSWSRESVKERLVSSMKFVHSLLSEEISNKLGFDLELKLVNLEAKRVPVRLRTDPELVGTSEIWAYLQINMTTVDSIIDDIFNGYKELVEIKKFTEDWCQFLEGSMIQEFAHVLYFESVCKSRNKDLFIKSLVDYPSLDTDIDPAIRNVYLVSEIEIHGRLVQVDFLRKVYPNSWALAWCEDDLKKAKELSV